MEAGEETDIVTNNISFWVLLLSSKEMWNIANSWLPEEEQLKPLATWGHLTQRVFCSQPLPSSSPQWSEEEARKLICSNLMVWRICKHVQWINVNKMLINCITEDFQSEFYFDTFFFGSMTPTSSSVQPLLADSVKLHIVIQIIINAFLLRAAGFSLCVLTAQT